MSRVALLVQSYLANMASFDLWAVYSVKDHHNLPTYSPLLNNTCVRHVVLDKWFSLNDGTQTLTLELLASDGHFELKIGRGSGIPDPRFEASTFGLARTELTFQGNEVGPEEGGSNIGQPEGLNV